MVLKRYFILRAQNSTKDSNGNYTIRLPTEFFSARSMKYIHFINARAEVNNIIISNLSFHADFIQHFPDYNGFVAMCNTDYNGFVAMCNTDYSKRKKWNLFYDMEEIKFHFRTFNGTIINDPDLQFNIELMLEF